MATLTPGRATAAGTAAFVDARIARQSLSPEHFRKAPLGGGEVYVSSLGLGTYLGKDDDATDAGYAAALVAALEAGGNVVDTASNYRNQRSERAVGEGLRRAAAKGFAREQVVVASKAGFLPFDGAVPADPKAYLEETFIRPGLIPADEWVGGCHSIAPKFLDFQFERSRENLGLETLDLYFLHNLEMQRGAVDGREFHRRLVAAVEALERKVAEGKLQGWGIATWDGLRVTPADPKFLDLRAILAAAREVAGESHHFRAVQLPYNLAMPEAHAFANQEPRGGGGPLTLLELAQDARWIVFASASILQGRLARAIPPEVAAAFPDAKTDAQRALQFVRSTPGVTTALCGMSRVAHVTENFRLAASAPKPAALLSLYRAA